jgi:DNA ligase D-like protein (predicted 3'-phosphoesterase)
MQPKGRAKKASGKPIYVIQLHKAKRMHFDFRLEVDGLLVSWAVPKGPSLDPKQKRLAVRTEDHPLEYADFEGNIPEGEYGAGTVIVWDKGVYENMSIKGDKGVSMSAALQAGHIKVRLFGKKLRGGYTLIQTKMRGEDKNWLLVKDYDDEADKKAFAKTSTVLQEEIDIGRLALASGFRSRNRNGRAHDFMHFSNGKFQKY